MDFKLLLFLCMILLNSCAFFSEKANQSLIGLGLLKSPDNQNYSKILKEGRQLVFGQLKIILEDGDITRYCLVGLNDSFNRRAVILWGKHVGDALIDIKDKKNTLYVLSCVRPGVPERFNYFFKESSFFSEGIVNYFGVIELRFSYKEGVDPYRKDSSENYKAPWLKEVSVKYDESIKQQLENRYEVKSDAEVSIIKESK